MSNDKDAKRAKAEARFKTPEAKPNHSAKARSEHDAANVARDANTERLKGLRLARDESDRASASEKANGAKSRSGGPPSGWGALNVAMNTLVKASVIVGYKTSRTEKETEPGVEVTIAPGADQAEVVSRVREALPEAFSGATVRTRQG